MQAPAEIIRFWFEDHGAPDWWGANPAFDAEIAGRFAETHASMARGEGFPWRASAAGRLAEIIVLDQFSRQLYRRSPLAFAQDGKALALAQEAAAGGHDRALASDDQRAFLYMPLMHAESLPVQRASVALFVALGGDYVEPAEQHLEVIRRFGRFPKRNAALGRTSTPEEIAYLEQSGDRMF